MMGALGEAPAVSVSAPVTEKSIEQALRETLPSINADTATLKVVMQKLAIRFGMEFADLKAQWRPQIKALLPDLLGLCPGGNRSEDEEEKAEPIAAQEEDEEEEVDLRPSRKRTERTTKKRNAVVDASDEDEEEDANDSGASETKHADVTPAKKRRTTTTKERKSKESGPPTKKIKMAKQQDPPGLASLKELGRAAGVLNPQLYKVLNRADSTEEAEDILRDRLHDAGIGFQGSYPSSRDISAAKRKHDKEKELEGIDTSLIITGGRSRRGGTSRISYKEERISGEEDNDDEEEDEDDGDEDSGGSDSDSSEASF